jgi:hypothetical protein
VLVEERMHFIRVTAEAPLRCKSGVHWVQVSMVVGSPNLGRSGIKLIQYGDS